MAKDLTVTKKRFFCLCTQWFYRNPAEPCVPLIFVAPDLRLKLEIGNGLWSPNARVLCLPEKHDFGLGHPHRTTKKWTNMVPNRTLRTNLPVILTWKRLPQILVIDHDLSPFSMLINIDTFLWYHHSWSNPTGTCPRLTSGSQDATDHHPIFGRLGNPQDQWNMRHMPKSPCQWRLNGKFSRGVDI